MNNPASNYRLLRAALVSLTSLLWACTPQTDQEADQQTISELTNGFADSAQWIGLPREQHRANLWTAYRKQFKLPAQPQSAIVRIAVDSKYWLWINGEMVVYEGGLKRGPNPLDTYYDEVDISTWLQPGQNTLAILARYFGKQGFSHNDSGIAGLIFDADIDGQHIVSDASWKLIRHPAYGNTQGIEPNWRLPESQVHFDAEKDIPGWEGADFDDSGWDNPSQFGVAGDAPWNQLHKRPTPLWRDNGIQVLQNGPQTPFVSNGETIHYDLPYNAQFTPYVEVEAPSDAVGQLIDMRTDTGQYDNEGTASVRSEYRVKSGRQQWESYGWMSGEQLILTVPKGITVHAVGYRETGYDVDFTAGLVSDHSDVNRLMQMAQRTLYINMRDTYFDTPDRERALWWGDVVLETGQSYYSLDRRADLLTRKSMRELINWGRDNGTLFAPVPTGNWIKELPLQMLNSVGYYGFTNFYMQSGDLELAKELYPGVYRYVLDVWQLGEDGLVDLTRISEDDGHPKEHGPQLEGEIWTWVEWGENIDWKVQANGWYALALKGLHIQAQLTGNEQDIEEIDRRMSSLKNNFDRHYWTGQAYRSADYEGEDDDRANALAVVSGLADEAQYPAIRKVLLLNEHASPYLEKSVQEALAMMGYHGDALERMRRRYATMVGSDISTLWEVFWSYYALPGGHGSTKNHAWNAPLIVPVEYALGLKVISPGYDRFEIAPNLDGYNTLELGAETVKGPLMAKLTRFDPAGDQAGYRMQLSTPNNSSADIKLPLDGISTIAQVTINGTPAWNGQTISQIAGVTINDRGERLSVELESGDWTIEVSGPQRGFFRRDNWDGSVMPAGDFVVLENTPETLDLNGLTPHTDYVFTAYIAPLETGDKRISLLDGGDDGFGKGEDFPVYQDSDGRGSAVSYRYNTGSNTSFSMRLSAVTEKGIQLSGFSNLVAPTSGSVRNLKLCYLSDSKESCPPCCLDSSWMPAFARMTLIRSFRSC